MSDRIDQTYYEILGVSSDAPPNEIQMAYRRAKETYSPDSPALYSMFTADEAKDLLLLIEEAYTTLSNQSLRMSYDQNLGGQNNEPLSSSHLTKKDEPIPEGFAKTNFGSYKVNDNFEIEIKERQNFDGHFLQRVRNYKNISIDQMSNVTRISRSYLHAIESNDFDSLPAAVFVRGFIVQIARHLGLDDKKVSKSFMIYFKQGYVD